jgi:hypothetical protein
MPSLYYLVRRRDDSQHDSQPGLTPTMTNLLVALVVLFAAIAILVGTLLILRQMRRTKKERLLRENHDTLPIYSEKPSAQHASSARSSRLTITTTSYEKEALMQRDNDGSLSPNDVPEIRITFPEEIDESGKRTSGKVVVVKIGEHSVGLEPCHEDLPPYQQSMDGGRFQSLDLDRVGGLKEKDMN